MNSWANYLIPACFRIDSILWKSMAVKRPLNYLASASSDGSILSKQGSIKLGLNINPFSPHRVRPTSQFGFPRYKNRTASFQRLFLRFFGIPTQRRKKIVSTRNNSIHAHIYPDNSPRTPSASRSLSNFLA